MAKRFITSVDILGVEYKVYENDRKHDKMLETNDGYVSYPKKQIVLDKDVAQKYKEHILSHEVVHAVLFESGLENQTKDGWAVNEEIVDWIAFQAAKITKASETVIKQMRKDFKDGSKKKQTIQKS